MKLTEETFLAQRKEVFFQQPAGAIDLQNAFDWQKSLQANNFPPFLHGRWKRAVC